MNVDYVANATAERLLDPNDALWQQAPGATLDLMGTPVAMQPTAAVRNTWEHKAVGAVKQARVRAAHNGRLLALRLSWQDSQRNLDHGDNTRFPDGAAVAFPLTPNSPLMTMGMPGAPLAIWFWRADSTGGGFQVRAEGPGTTRIVDTAQVRTQAHWQDGEWHVVIARAFDSAEADTIRLRAGQPMRFGIAVWEGGQQERGGLKAISMDWQPLVIAKH